MTPPLQIQQAPKEPEYAAAGIQVPANIATPQATMDNVKAGQSQLNAVNSLSGGGSRHSRGRSRSARYSKNKRDWKPKSFIRTYKGRKYQTGGSDSGSGAGAAAIPIPQVGSPCSGGPQCAGAQNASFTAIHNQAMSNGKNDAYAAAQTGGRRRKVRFSKRRTYYHRGSSQSRKPRHDQSLTSMIAYNIKKVMRKVFS
jgi:hypothetical protein